MTEAIRYQGGGITAVTSDQMEGQGGGQDNQFEAYYDKLLKYLDDRSRKGPHVYEGNWQPSAEFALTGSENFAKYR